MSVQIYLRSKHVPESTKASEGKTHYHTSTQPAREMRSERTSRSSPRDRQASPWTFPVPVAPVSDSEEAQSIEGRCAVACVGDAMYLMCTITETDPRPELAPMWAAFGKRSPRQPLSPIDVNGCECHSMDDLHYIGQRATRRIRSHASSIRDVRLSR